jgi:hypothetical protein
MCFVFAVFETMSHYVAQAGLELVIFLPQLPKSWITGVHDHISIIPRIFFSLFW